MTAVITQVCPLVHVGLFSFRGAFGSAHGAIPSHLNAAFVTVEIVLAHRDPVAEHIAGTRHLHHGA